MSAVAPNQGCPLPDGSLVTLLATPLLGMGLGIPVELGGTGQPLPHGTFTPPATFTSGVVLYPDDVTAIRAHIDGYNAAIAASASANGAILVDSHAVFNEIASSGFSIGGVTVTTSFLTGGIFSFDGVHPSAIGYGIAANEFIKALNASAGTSIPLPNFAQILFTPNVPDLPGGARTAAPTARTTRSISRAGASE